MAGAIGVAKTVEVALVAGSAKTVLQVASAANHPIKIKEWLVSFDGKSVTAEPIKVRLLRQTTAGTMSSLTPKERTKWGITLQTTAQYNATAEPTAGNELAGLEVHPQQGYHDKLTLGDEILVGGASVDRIGIECTLESGETVVNAIAQIVFEE